MSSISDDWAPLASDHERVVAAGEHSVPAGSDPVSSLPARWDELASQRERLVVLADPLSGLASSSQSGTAFRLAVSAASAA
jgi:hypothetical protein